jgi:exonuclease SbcD
MGEDSIRILHTADWHLGREFHGKDLTELHRRFFDWLIAEIEERQVDLVVMAGDIYDRALPPLEAIGLFNSQIDRLADVAPTVLITGNHDSTIRMSHGRLLREGICLRSGTDLLGKPEIFDSFAFPLAVYPVPYLDPISSGPALGVGQTHEEVLGEATRMAREDLERRPEGTRSVLVAHAFVTGAETSDSERGIFVGGAEDVPAATFDGFDYTALGHLHRPQEPGARVRYSGSPLCLSFSESNDVKSVSLVDLDSAGSVSIEEVPVPRWVEVSRVSGLLDDLLADPEHRSLADHWLEVTLEDRTQPDSPMERLESVFNEVLSLRFSELGPEQAGRQAEELEALSRQEPMRLLEQFLVEVRGEGPDEEERRILQAALDHRSGSESRN